MNNGQIGYMNSQNQLSPLPIYNTVHKGGNEQYTKRYYSSTEAEIFFSGARGELLPGNGFVDEIVQIQFSIQQNVMPLFGYNSYVYDEVATGSRIVQGSFSINFTSPNYLFDLLESVNGDIATNTNHRAMWQAPFSVDIVYGGGSTSINNGGRLSEVSAQRGTLEGVSILSCSQELNIEGVPVLEHYTFVARDYVPNASRVEAGDSKPIIAESPKVENLIKIEDIVTNAFLWPNSRKEWFVFVDTNTNYSDVLESISIVLKDGFLPNNVKKSAVKQKNGRWGITGLNISEVPTYKVEITARIKGSGNQTISKNIAIRTQL